MEPMAEAVSTRKLEDSEKTTASRMSEIECRQRKLDKRLVVVEEYGRTNRSTQQNGLAPILRVSSTLAERKMEINRGLKLSFRIIAALILFAAIAPLGIGIWAHSNTRSFLDSAESTTAEVVELVERRGSEGGSVFAPRVRFQDHAGESYEVTSSSASSPPRYFVGEKIDILYNPDRPQEFRTTDWFSLRGIEVLAITSAGIAVLFAGLFAFLMPVILQGIISAFRKPEPTGQPDGRGNE